jgi:hypothetical protein
MNANEAASAVIDAPCGLWLSLHIKRWGLDRRRCRPRTQQSGLETTLDAFYTSKAEGMGIGAVFQFMLLASEIEGNLVRIAAAVLLSATGTIRIAVSGLDQ